MIQYTYLFIYLFGRGPVEEYGRIKEKISFNRPRPPRYNKQTMGKK